MTTLAGVFLLMATAYAGEWDVHPRYEHENTFKRIGEYLGGKEHYSNRIVMRTQNDSRGGFYWVIYRGRDRVELPKGGKFVLEYYPQASGTSKKHEYAIAERSDIRTIYLGITGNDWPSTKAKPLAWRIQLLDAKGKLLASEQSYLWEFPAN